MTPLKPKMKSTVEFPNFLLLFKLKLWYGDFNLCNSFAGYFPLKKIADPKQIFDISAGIVTET
jgi:hypothetical protein